MKEPQVKGLREKIAELYWLKYRDGCHYPGYWEKDWATLVRQSNDELCQRYMDTCREFANQILTEVLGDLLVPIDGELPELPLYQISDGQYANINAAARIVQQDMVKAGYHQTAKVKDILVAIKS